MEKIFKVHKSYYGYEITINFVFSIFAVPYRYAIHYEKSGYYKLYECKRFFFIKYNTELISNHVSYASGYVS